MSGIKNYTIHKGATFSESITYQDSEGVAIDLTGFTATMVILDDWDGNIIETVTGVIATPTNGTILLTITDETTATYNVSTGVYKLDIESGGGEVTRLLTGKMSILN